MQTRSAKIANSQGIHCRPSALLVKECMDYGGKIRVWNENGSCDLSSVLQVLALELHQGSGVQIEVEGPDEEKMADRLVELFETHFDFPPLD